MSSTAPTRREFAATLALASLAACTSRSAATGAPAPAPAAAPDSAAAGAPSPVVDALSALVDARFPARLTAETRKSVRGGIGRLETLAGALRSVPLANGVGPYSVCAAPARGPEGAR